MRGSFRWLPGLACLSALGALAAFGLMASAYSTPGGSGNLSLEQAGAPPSALWLQGGSPPRYQVNETLTVSVGDVLQLAAGSEIAFVNGTKLVVLGGLEVVGAPGLPVVMHVVPDIGAMAVSWDGIYAQAASPFRLENAVINDTIDVAFANGTGALVRGVAYQGRLLIDNATQVDIEDVAMEHTPTDVGRISIWIENSGFVRVRRADLHAGTGWGGAAVLLENSADILLEDLLVRDDNQNLVGFKAILSQRVRLVNYTFSQGPLGGDPNEALEFDTCEGIWVEGVRVTYVGTSGLGAIYGVRSNVTLANSTFPAGLSPGVWQGPGRLVTINATRVPIRPESGGEVVEYELLRARVVWEAGGLVPSGNASVNGSAAGGTVPFAAGLSGWIALLRETNASGALTTESAYTVRALCNCTGASRVVTLADEEGVTVEIPVADAVPPVAVATGRVGATGADVVLDGASSFDNAGLGAYLWRALGAPNATGLPCAQAVCRAVFFEPGTFTLELNVTDTSGNVASLRVQVAVADVTAPQVRILSQTPTRPGQGEPFTVAAEAFDNDPAFLPRIAWFVDGANVTGDTLALTVAVAAIGPHEVRLEVRDDAGNLAQANVTVEVRDSTAPVIGEFQSPAGLKAPATVELNGSIAADNVAVVSWVWRIQGEGTDYNVAGPAGNATLPSAGRYNVTLTARDAEGNAGSRTFVVDVAAVHGDLPPAGVGLLEVVVLLGATVAAGALVIVWWRGKKPGP